MINRNDLERLTEIKSDVLELLNEVRAILRGTREEERAKAYWMAHIRCALDDEHMYLGGSQITMQDTIDALSEADEEDAA